jgi:H+-transporting ATPase
MKTSDDYQTQSIDDTLRELQVDINQGLDSEQVKKRLEQYGPNTISEKQEPLWHRLLRRFWGPIPWMIEIAAVLSALVQKWEDFIIIIIMLLVNAFLDFFQEHRALNALKALKQKLALEVTVIRDGHFMTIPSQALVPGDIVKLRIGDIVPADVKLLKGQYLSIDQSALTGESLPISKKSNQIAYANTIIKQGEMTAVVVNTGNHTNFHSVVALVAKVSLEERSHFQKMVVKIGNFLIVITLVLVALIIAVGIYREENLLEILRFAMVLTVAAIPVALPAVLSVTMAVGATNLARKQAIVSRLTAIEELAGVDIFCSDKTGTLTKNQMQISDPIIMPGHSEEELFLFAVLASQKENNDPLEMPLFEYMESHFPDSDWQSYQQHHFIPFDPVRKRTEAEVSSPDDTHYLVIKGAPQVLIQMAALNEESTREIQQKVDQLASKGYRTIAVGEAIEHGPGLTLIGLIPMYDPPREDSHETIKNMADYGVKVKMVTGDHIAIAREIGHLMGLKGRAIVATELKGSSRQPIKELVSVLSQAIVQKLKPEISLEQAKQFANDVLVQVQSQFNTDALDKEFIHTHESTIIEMVETIDIFAQVIPEDKYRIVDTLQKAGHIVAMTGDGVNDAPALKKSDCGFAVSNATDAARAAADIILTSPGLSVINDAIKQARITFERMKSYTIFRIAETIRIVLFMTLSIVIFNFYPITALMIIILALLNDIPILAIAYDNTKIMKKPVTWNMPEILTVASTLGITGVISSFLLFFVLDEMNFSHSMIQSMMFAKLVIAGHGTIYNTRIDDWFWKRPYPSWTLFWATFSTRVLGTLIAVYGFMITPIGWTYAAYMWIYALVWFVFNDVIKMLTYRYLRRHGDYNQ